MIHIGSLASKMQKGSDSHNIPSPIKNSVGKKKTQLRNGGVWFLQWREFGRRHHEKSVLGLGRENTPH
jgi:hypothetical protein